MNIAQQTQALLALVEADRARRCDAILGEARARAAVLLRDAHDDARHRMRAMFVEERERMAARINAAQANLETRRRVAHQQRAAALLAAAWPRLSTAFAARWKDAQGRQAWVRGVAASARGVLRPGAWRIFHAPGLAAADRDALTSEFPLPHGITMVFVEDPAIRAGLKIATDGNLVDGTQAGLLADRAEVGARLLALLEAAPKGAA